MFVGHAGIALAAKSRAQTVSLGWLMAAAFGLDLIWPVLILTGIERASIVPGATAFNPLVFDSYPWSHSLLMSAVWAALVIGSAIRLGCSRSVALILGALVASHWFLDLITHVPDLPLVPGSPARAGLGLWNSVAATVAVEGTLYVAGIVLYVRTTKASDRAGSIALWILLLLLAGNRPGPRRHRA